jgi:hypothetical protein
MNMWSSPALSDPGNLLPQKIDEQMRMKMTLRKILATVLFLIMVRTYYERAAVADSKG